MKGMTPTDAAPDPSRNSQIADQLTDYAGLLYESAAAAEALAQNFREIDPDDPLGANAALDPKHLQAEAVSLMARTSRDSRMRAERMAARVTTGIGAISINKTASLLGVAVNTLRAKLPSKAAPKSSDDTGDIF